MDWASVINAMTSVALRKESVDRNPLGVGSLITLGGSLSARRAWIEITVVATLATLVTASLSARRAWIEMDVTAKTGLFTSSRSPQGERG